MGIACVLIGVLFLVAIPIAVAVWWLGSLRQQPTQRREQKPDSGHADASWTELATQFFGEDSVREMDRQYGPEYKMALLDEMLWEDSEEC